MARVSIQRLVKGDVIVEQVNGKNRMTPVTKVEFNACSTHGVHVNRSMCYEFNAVVNLLDEKSTLGDLEKELDKMPEEMSAEEINAQLKKELDELADDLLYESMSRLY